MPLVQYLQHHKQINQAFWLQFGNSHHGTATSNKSKAETLQALIDIGDIVLRRSPKARTPEFNRTQYIRYKSKLHGYNGFVLCFACGGPAQVRHHMIWIRNGGRNHKKNIVPLCYSCHAVIHPWLKA